MKFSLRLVVLVGLSLLMLIVFIIWGSKLSILSSKPKKSITNSFYPEHVRKFVAINENFNPKTVFDSSRRIYDVKNNLSCSLILKSRAITDINTDTVLHKIDERYNSSWIEDPQRNMKSFMYIKQNPLVNIEGRKNKLKIIALPHSHNDPGWLKTLNEYFEDQTHKTLNYMVEKLLKYPNMTFIWAESVFLSMWWRDVDKEMRSTVRQLIQRKQLEIVGGSWVVPDEATSHYFGIIDQMIEGHQWLENNLGIKPKNTWSLDPFGYSPTLAYLYKKAGFKNMVILRIHQFIKEYFQGNLAMDFYWRQHWDKTGQTDILTTILPYALYNIKHQCGPDQFECVYFDFRNIEGEISESMAETINSGNVAKYAKRLLVQLTKKNHLYKHNVVLLPIGDDFRFDRNIEWDQQYLNFQKLFNYMNSKSDWNVHAKFGTLQDYFDLMEEEVYETKAIQFPSLQGDFFPYTDKNEEYWTGYFTTRPYDKNFERELETNLRTAEILNVLAKALSRKGETYLYYKSNVHNLEIARQNLGLFQHHDGITGTARAFVVLDYEHRLQQGLTATKNVIEKASEYLMAKNRDETSFIQFLADQPKSLYILNPGKIVMDFKDGGNKTVVLCNPTGQQKEDVIRITVNYEYLEVYNQNDNLILSQINPLWHSEYEISKNKFQLVFLTDMPPLSLVKYTIVSVPKNKKPKENLAAFISFNHFKYPVILSDSTRFVSVPPRGETLTLENSFLRARFSARSGYLQSITTKARLATKKIQTELLMYKSRRSGAYIFSPTGPAVDTEMFNLPPMMVIKGPVVSEIHIFQRESVCEHIVRVYNSTGLIGTVLEINNFANMSLKDDKELVLKFTTDIKNVNSTFYTDLNGLHSIKRKRFKNFPREANYYPMTSFAYLEDEETRLSILSTQSLGVSSQEDGSLEVMIERKPLYDDGRGLGEGIYDNKRTPSQFYLLLEKPSHDNSKEEWNRNKKFSSNNNLESFPSLHSYLLLEHLQHHTVVLHDFSKKNLLRTTFEPLQTSLPCDMTLVNLRGILPVSGIKPTEKPLTAALILHKLGFDCSFPVMGFKCDYFNQYITPSKLFDGIQFDVIKNVSLSLMYEYNNVDLNSPLVLNPMDLQSYKVIFKAV